MANILLQVDRKAIANIQTMAISPVRGNGYEYRGGGKVAYLERLIREGLRR